MTFLEKYKSEHGGAEPEISGRLHVCPNSNYGYRFTCPSQFGYEPDDYACDYVATCKDCWDREMQEVYHE